MSNDLQKLVRQYSVAIDKTGKTLSALIDYMVASDLSPDNLKDKEHSARMAVDAGIVASFTKTTQALLKTPTKELLDANKAEKRYAQQQIGSRRAKIIKALDERLNPVERGPVERKPDDVWLRDTFNAFVKRVETSEGAGDLDLVEIADWLAKSPLA
tara:strand:+ start:3576 stop:4046 length:471 start_codon:yes stop_codon:yes gene_type:complete